MHDRAQGVVLGLTGIVGGVVVGQAASGAVSAVRLTSLGIWVVLAAVVAIRPAVAVHVGLGVLILELFVVSSLLRLGAILLLLCGVVVAWRTATRAQRSAAVLFLLLATWVIFVGVVLAERTAQQPGIAIALLFAGCLAACAAVARPSITLVVTHMSLWGFGLAVWVTTHPERLVSRGGDIVAGENADSLGILISVGAVASLALTRDLHRRWMPIAIVGALVSGEALLLTGSRGAVLVLIVGLAGVLSARYWSERPFRVVALGALGAAILWVSGDWVIAQFLLAAGRDIEVEHGADLRSRLAAFAWQEGVSHPFTGIGVGRLEEVGIGTGGVGLSASAHNTFLGLLAAAGFPALLIFLAILVICLRRALRVNPALCLPVIAAVVIAGLSVEWWAAHRMSPLLMLSLALPFLTGLPETPRGSWPERDSRTMASGVAPAGHKPRWTAR